MSDQAEPELTKRSVVKAAGAALAAGVGAAGTATAHCECDQAPEHCCDTSGCCDDADRFCGMTCVATTADAKAYDRCPFDAQSHVTYLNEGRTTFVGMTCTSDGDCYQAVKGDFCGETWWVRSSDLKKVPDSECTC